MCVHSSLKTMAGRALSLMRSRDFRTQVPQHAGNNDQCGKQDKNVQPLAVEYPADYKRGQDVTLLEMQEHTRMLPTSERGNWIAAIQNIMPKVDSVIVSFLVAIMVMA